MMRSAKFLSLALIVAVTSTRPAHAADLPVRAVLMKPIALTKIRDLEFGSLAFDNFTGTRSISLAQDGKLTCAAPITCTGPRRTARFNIQGVAGEYVSIRVASTDLTGGLHTIPFTADAPLRILIPGTRAGVDFDIGGTLTVISTLNGGIYSGTITVTTDYQ